ncbi:hypothetical protein ON010_g1546 [Phytophthora cinnamomi]|nr:hypothetical protein ON010_g1546 [Phytophthora cinnamomi]
MAAVPIRAAAWRHARRGLVRGSRRLEPGDRGARAPGQHHYRRGPHGDGASRRRRAAAGRHHAQGHGRRDRGAVPRPEGAGRRERRRPGRARAARPRRVPAGAARAGGAQHQSADPGRRRHLRGQALPRQRGVAATSRNSSFESFVVCQDFHLPEGFVPDMERNLLDLRYSEEAEDEDAEDWYTSRVSAERGVCVDVVFMGAGDVFGYDADQSYPLDEGEAGNGEQGDAAKYVHQEPLQKPINPPYANALKKQQCKQ